MLAGKSEGMLLVSCSYPDLPRWNGCSKDKRKDHHEPCHEAQHNPYDSLPTPHVAWELPCCAQAHETIDNGQCSSDEPSEASQSGNRKHAQNERDEAIDYRSLCP